MIRNVRPLNTSPPASSVGVAIDVYDEFYASPRSLIRWQGTWWEWTGALWREMSEEALDSELQRILLRATYLDRNGQPTPWDPTDTKIAKVRNGLKSIAQVPDEARPGQWFDGRRDRAIPCAGGYIGWDPSYVSGNDGLEGWRHYPADSELFATSALTVSLGEWDEPHEWLAFLADSFRDPVTGEVDQDGINALQEWFGYLISGRTDLQVMLQLLGPPRSGKGTIGRVIAALYGAAYGSTTMDTLGYRFGLQGVLAKPVLVLSDVRDARPPAMAIERILSITGEDPVRIEIKHGEGVTAQIPSRIMIVANSVLSLSDNAGAISARSIFIKTRNSAIGREDRTLGNTLTSNSQLHAILRWAFHGLERLQLNGDRFTVQQAGAEDRSLASDLGSPIREFLNEHYSRQVGARSTSWSDFQKHYIDWRRQAMRDYLLKPSEIRLELEAVGLKVSQPKNADRRTLPAVVHDIIPNGA